MPRGERDCRPATEREIRRRRRRGGRARGCRDRQCFLRCYRRAAPGIPAHTESRSGRARPRLNSNGCLDPQSNTIYPRQRIASPRPERNILHESRFEKIAARERNLDYATGSAHEFVADHSDRQRGKMERGELSGKTAIVTGAGRGLGRAMALGLLGAGANVVITAARTLQEIEMVADESVKIQEAGTLRKFAADVTSEKDCRFVVTETIREFGSGHILVNNAGR